MEWDDKFGVIEDNRIQYMTSPNIQIKGVGKDAEIVTNKDGGKQSKAPMAMHLLDPTYLYDMARDRIEALEYETENEVMSIDEEDKDKYSCYNAICNIAMFMRGVDDIKPTYLDLAMDCLEPDEENQMIKIAEVLLYGATHGNNGQGYPVNNWRLIPQEEHINHALIHIIAHIKGDTQDEHINHALCRLMMARATKRSEGFSYTSYVKKTS